MGDVPGEIRVDCEGASNHGELVLSTRGRDVIAEIILTSLPFGQPRTGDIKHVACNLAAKV